MLQSKATLATLRRENRTIDLLAINVLWVAEPLVVIRGVYMTSTGRTVSNPIPPFFVWSEEDDCYILHGSKDGVLFTPSTSIEAARVVANLVMRRNNPRLVEAYCRILGSRRTPRAITVAAIRAVKEVDSQTETGKATWRGVYIPGIDS